MMINSIPAKEVRAPFQLVLAVRLEISSKGWLIFCQAISGALDQTSIRPDDPEIVVHSTTLANWQKIRADRELKAASQLSKRESTSDELSEIEQYYQNEPPEYQDYIMFGEVDSLASEMVLASNAKGYFVMDPEAEYQPGVRLYFDHHHLISDGIAIRDGLHLAKVHRRLSLKPHLLAAISVADIDPGGEIKVWTLRKFTEEANRFFRSRKSKS